MENFKQEYRDKIVIETDLFRIDPSGQKLISLEHQNVEIPYDQMRESATFYSFPYYRFIEVPDYKNREHAQDMIITIPKDILQLEHNYGPKEYDNINQQSRYTNCGFQLLGELYINRIGGKLPVLNLDNETFPFDIVGESINSDKGKKLLSFDELKFTSDMEGNWCECAFNLRTKKFLPINDGWEVLPKDTIQVKFRPYGQLDPVGWALKFGKSTYSYLNSFALTENIPYRTLTDKMSMISQLLPGRQINTTKKKAAKKKIT